LRIFPHDKISADVILASACLPLLFRAVEIDGVPYWDGGYLGNPSIFPLFNTTQTEDVLLIQINPLVRHHTPTTSRDIVSRLNEITFNSPLMGELRAIEFVSRLIDQGRLTRGLGPGKYRRINMHRIALDASAKLLSAEGRLNTDFNFFELLKTNDRRAARRFLDAHFGDIGVRGTVDLQAEVKAEWA
jgi:NTE family protein